MVYTISPDLLRNIDADEQVYFSDILFVISQRTNPFKVAIDINKSVIKDYSSIKNHNAHLIKSWLDLMSFKPSSFEPINVNIESIECEEDKYLKLCKETVGYNKIIFYSKQNIRKYPIIKDVLLFEQKAIKVLDKDVARLEITSTDKIQQTIIGSQVAQNHSSINKSKNE